MFVYAVYALAFAWSEHSLNRKPTSRSCPFIRSDIFYSELFWICEKNKSCMYEYHGNKNNKNYTRSRLQWVWLQRAPNYNRVFP